MATPLPGSGDYYFKSGTGEIFPVKSGDAGPFLAGGYTPASPQEVTDWQTKQAAQKSSEGFLPALGAFAESAARTATFGTSTEIERALEGVVPGFTAAEIRAREEGHPLASFLGAGGAALGLTALSGGTAGPELIPSLGEAGEGLAPGLIDNIGRRVQGGVEKALAAPVGESSALRTALVPVASHVARGAAEMGLYRAGDEVSDRSLGDPGWTAEAMLASGENVGVAALVGGAFGLPVGVMSGLMKSVGPKVAKLGAKVAPWLRETEEEGMKYQLGVKPSTSIPVEKPIDVDTVAAEYANGLKEYLDRVQTDMRTTVGREGSHEVELQNLLSPVSPEKVGQSVRDLSAQIRTTLQEIEKNPQKYPRSAAFQKFLVDSDKALRRVPLAEEAPSAIAGEEESLPFESGSSERPRPMANTAPSMPAAPVTRIVTPAGAEQALYDVVEARDLVSSHDPFTFQPDRRYPAQVQERNYFSNENKQREVLRGGDQLDAERLLGTTPTAENGSPIVTGGDVPLVLGGNGRSMMIKRAYESGRAPAVAYREMLERLAPAFGLDADAVATMKQPVLVRRLTSLSDTSPATELRSAVRRFNQTLSQRLSPVEQGISDSQLLTPGTIGQIGEMLEAAPEKSLRDLMREEPQRFMDLVDRDGIVAPTERAEWITAGGLTEQARGRIEGMLLGRVLGSNERLAVTAPGILRKIERIISPLTRVDAINPGMSQIESVRGAVDLLNEAQRRGMSLAELVAQEALPGLGVARDPAAWQMARILEQETPNELAQRFRGWAQKAGFNPNQGRMFGKSPTPEDLDTQLRAGVAQPSAEFLPSAIPASAEPVLPATSYEVFQAVKGFKNDLDPFTEFDSSPTPKNKAVIRLAKSLRAAAREDLEDEGRWGPAAVRERAFNRGINEEETAFKVRNGFDLVKRTKSNTGSFDMEPNFTKIRTYLESMGEADNATREKAVERALEASQEVHRQTVAAAAHATPGVVDLLPEAVAHPDLVAMRQRLRGMVNQAREAKIGEGLTVGDLLKEQPQLLARMSDEKLWDAFTSPDLLRRRAAHLDNLAWIKALSVVDGFERNTPSGFSNTLDAVKLQEAAKTALREERLRSPLGAKEIDAKVRAVLGGADTDGGVSIGRVEALASDLRRDPRAVKLVKELDDRIAGALPSDARKTYLKAVEQRETAAGAKMIARAAEGARGNRGNGHAFGWMETWLLLSGHPVEALGVAGVRQAVKRHGPGTLAQLAGMGARLVHPEREAAIGALGESVTGTEKKLRDFADRFVHGKIPFAAPVEAAGADALGRINRVRSMAANPDDLVHTIAAHTAQLADHAPNVAAMTSSTLAGQVAVLNKSAPPTASVGLDKEQPPKREQLDNFARAWEIAHDPIGALNRGMVDAQSVELLRQMWPSLSNQVRLYVGEALKDMRGALDAPTQLAVSRLMGAPMSGWQAPDTVQWAQAAMAATMAKHPRAGMGGTRSVHLPGSTRLKLSQRTALPLDSKPTEQE